MLWYCISILPLLISMVPGLHADKSTQQQVILQARAAAPLMRMEGVFWQGKEPDQLKPLIIQTLQEGALVFLLLYHIKA